MAIFCNLILANYSYVSHSVIEFLLTYNVKLSYLAIFSDSPNIHFNYINLHEDFYHLVDCHRCYYQDF